MQGLGLGKITERQEKAIIALLEQPTIGMAAKAAGVGERTLHTWLDVPEFIRAYCAARRRAFKQAIGLCQRYSPLAVQTLAVICKKESAPAAARVTAAAYLLKFGRDSIELEDLAARVDLLERSAGVVTANVIDALPAAPSRPADEPTAAEPPADPPVVVPPPRVKRGRKPGPQPKRKGSK